MHSVLEREPIVSSAVSQPTTLKAVLEQLDIIPFTAESVASYKRKKMTAVMEEIKNRAGLTQEMIPAYWERQVLCRLKPDEAFHLANWDARFARCCLATLANVRESESVQTRI